MLERERYLVAGPEGWSAEELIAMVLGGPQAREAARRLAEHFGGLPRLADASPVALAEVAGVGPVGAVRLHAALALGRATRVEAIPSGERVDGPRAAVRWFMPRLDGLPHEELHGLYLDRRGTPLAWRRLSVGCDGYTIVDPATVLRPAVQVGATSVVLAHNHPSGDAEPSQEDIQATLSVRAGATVLGVRLLDHIIVGAARWVSLAERGHLP